MLPEVTVMNTDKHRSDISALLIILIYDLVPYNKSYNKNDYDSFPTMYQGFIVSCSVPLQFKLPVKFLGEKSYLLLYYF